MAKDEQIDKGVMKKYITPNQKKVSKKLHKKKVRKTKITEMPTPNRYTGGWSV
jgi:hypothetical protein